MIKLIISVSVSFFLAWWFGYWIGSMLTPPVSVLVSGIGGLLIGNAVYCVVYYAFD